MLYKSIKSMKKMHTFVFCILLTAAICISCTDVITVDLNTAEPRIVIEGVITDQPGPYRVTIHKTTDYFKPGDFPPVSGAVVRISDNTGNSELLQETDTGIYITTDIQGVSGKTYTLSVESEGENYTAFSTMPEALELDSLTFFADEDYPDEYSVVCFFQDRVDIEDYIRLKVFKEGVLSQEYYLYDDRLTDGMYIDYEFFEETFYSGNEIKVDLLTFDRSVYEYFSTLWNIVTYDEGEDDDDDGGGEALWGQPANPLSNLTNNALGYFGAVTVKTYTIIIQ